MTKSMRVSKSIPHESALSGLARRAFWLSLLLFMSSLLMLTAAASLYNRSRTERKVYPAAKAFPSGQLVKMGSVELTIENVEQSDGSPPFVAPTGSVYVIADLVVQNTTDAPLQIMPTVDTYAKTETGMVSTLATYAYTQPFRAGELLPGEMIRGQIAYLVPRDKTVKLFVMQRGAAAFCRLSW